MKKRLGYFLASLIAGPVLTVTPVVLAEASTTTSSPPSTTTKTTPPADTRTSAERVAAVKAAYKTKLTAADEAKLKLKCKAGQTILQTHGTKIDTVTTTRTKVYDDITANLDSLATKLKDKKVDMTTFQTQITELKAKIVTFNTDLTKYKTAITDVSTLDCVADPTAFKAALEAARTAQQTVAADSLAIRTYIVGTIRPTITTLRASLVAATADTTSNSTTVKTSGGQ